MYHHLLSYEEIEHIETIMRVGAPDIPYIWIYYYDESRENEEGIAFAPYEDRFIENMKKFNYAPTKEEIKDYIGIEFLSKEEILKEEIMLILERE